MPDCEHGRDPGETALWLSIAPDRILCRVCYAAAHADAELDQISCVSCGLPLPEPASRTVVHSYLPEANLVPGLSSGKTLTWRRRVTPRGRLSGKYQPA